MNQEQIPMSNWPRGTCVLYSERPDANCTFCSLSDDGEVCYIRIHDEGLGSSSGMIGGVPADKVTLYISKKSQQIPKV
jgi:hypothetical protein